jgi:hypothetical protein
LEPSWNILEPWFTKSFPFSTECGHQDTAADLLNYTSRLSGFERYTLRKRHLESFDENRRVSNWLHPYNPI